MFLNLDQFKELNRHYDKVLHAESIARGQHLAVANSYLDFMDKYIKSVHTYRLKACNSLGQPRSAVNHLFHSDAPKTWACIQRLVELVLRKKSFVAVSHWSLGNNNSPVQRVRLKRAVPSGKKSKCVCRSLVAARCDDRAFAHARIGLCIAFVAARVVGAVKRFCGAATLLRMVVQRVSVQQRLGICRRRLSNYCNRSLGLKRRALCCYEKRE